MRAKARAAVDHFRCNALAGEMLRSVEQQLSLPERSLLLDSPTARWTQTYRMLQRLAELREAVVSALALLVDNVPADLLTGAEWDVVICACELLRPMYEVVAIIYLFIYLRVYLCIYLFIYLFVKRM